MKRRLRQGAKLIVIDPREIALVRRRTSRPTTTCRCVRAPTSPLFNSLAHVIVTEGLTKDALRRRALRDRLVRQVEGVRRRGAQLARERRRRPPGVKPELVREAARLYATAGNGAIYYGLGVTEHSQGSTMVMCIANLAMATGNVGREGVGINPLRGQNNVQGSCDMGSFPHEFSALPSRVGRRGARDVREGLGRPLLGEPGLRIPNMFEAALDGSFKGMYIQGEDPAQSDPDTQHVTAALHGDGVRRRPGSVPERNGELRARLPARLVVPREGRDVHQRRAARSRASAR